MILRAWFAPAVVASLALGSGCLHWDLERNAPGNVDLDSPPRETDRDRPERPSDPGERALLFGIGPMLGVGQAGNGSVRTLARAGGELSLEIGASSPRHWGFLQDDTGEGRGFEINPFLPDRAWGVCLGFSALETGGGLALRDLSIELQVRKRRLGFALAAGGLHDPATDRSGILATLAFGPLYLRPQYRFGGEWQVLLGLVLKARLGWVWSR